MAIKEKDLQTIEQLSDGDKLRVVTSDGNSRNVDASSIGGDNIFYINTSLENTDEWTLDKTVGEIHQAYYDNKIIFLRLDGENVHYILEKIEFSGGMAIPTDLYFTEEHFEFNSSNEIVLNYSIFEVVNNGNLTRNNSYLKVNGTPLS